DDAKKRAILISQCGNKTYLLLRNLMAPDKPSGKSYADLVKRLKDHFSPTPSEIVERWKFYERKRKDGEPVAAYVAELKKLSEHCNFGANLAERLRDAFVCGVNSDIILRKLLTETALTFDKAVEIATTIESTDKNTVSRVFMQV